MTDDASSTPGYWVVDPAGNVSNLGAAAGFGGHPTPRPGETVSAISATPSGSGYWLFTDRGRVFPYGDMANAVLNGPIVGISPTPDNRVTDSSRPMAVSSRSQDRSGDRWVAPRQPGQSTGSSRMATVA